MQVYVLSYVNGTIKPLLDILSGCYGVFSSLKKAQNAAIANINSHSNEVILDCENDICRCMFLYYTNFGTWKIEEMELDDVGIV